MFTDEDLYTVAVRRITGCSVSEAHDLWAGMSATQRLWWRKVTIMINDQFENLRDTDAAR